MPDTPNPGTKTDYIKTIKTLTDQVYALEDEAVARAIKLLAEAQTAINARIGDASGWRLANLESLKMQVKQILLDFERRYGAELVQVYAKAYGLGALLVDEPLKVSGVRVMPARLDANTLAVLQGWSADLIKNISQNTITAVNGVITNSLIGLTSPFDAQQAITQIIGVSRPDSLKDSLSQLTGISADAERIFRTETGRVSSIATQARQEQMVREVPDMVKSWLSHGDHRTRSGHLAAHGQTVPVDGYFLVAGKIGDPLEELSYPLDPAGSEGNVINCRCRSVTFRSGYGEFMPASTARVDAERARRASEVRQLRRAWSLRLHRSIV